MKALKPCGTRTAYARHLRYREKPCTPCRIKNAEHQAERNAACKLLRMLFLPEFKALFAAAEPGPNRWNQAANALARKRPEEFTALLAEVRAEGG